MRQFLRRLAAPGAPRRRLQAALQRNASHVSAQCDRSQCRRIKRALAQRCASSITALDEQRLAALPVEKTVTFSIVAHVDHGKSSLAQRLLEMYGNIASTDAVGQSALDTLDVERERGITVKAVTASMLVGEYLVNLVDTPGHADFAHEVRRSLGACDGALLLVDASQGIEAQTLKVAAAARAAGVPLVCAASKIDLPTADAVEVALELAALEFTKDPEDVLYVSAKSGDGVDGVMPAIIDAFKQPADDRRARPTRCRVLDGRYDITRGVVAVIQCVDGSLREGDRIAFLGGDGKEHTVQELGLLTPAHHRTGFLNAGCVGYLVAGLRDVRQARVGDTLCLATERDRLEPVDPLPPATQPGLFASVFPPDGGLFDEMSRAVDRLALNDASVTVRREAKARPTLGAGLRLGFLGLLHMDVFRQRLRDEFGAEVLFTSPTVPYKVRWKDGNVTTLEALDDWPDAAQLSREVSDILEPVVDIEVVTPREHVGACLEHLETARAQQTGIESTLDGRSIIACAAPWASVVDGLGERLAHASRGHATLAVDELPRYEAADVAKVDVLLNGEPVEALAFAARSADARDRGRRAVEKLRRHVPRQLFECIIQARVNGAVVARARIAPLRKDVLTTGGSKAVLGKDRKKKLLEKQKRGKARQKTIGKVALGQDALWAVVGS
ncbi:unnamed protein product [Pelagomonas calceolata]|uniref:Translation factor GUF1 homolog, mitochondrial n=1 Tax=Pelagomonas calceolata TaxID=35677 RepID=A0A8J2SY92_9STRA|nr:unnamed protein product [Pelagomonas calceolata]